MNHESGSAQMEINFQHGNPLELADQIFLFKRTLRQSALKHKLYATFMAKPYDHLPGNGLHLHLSLWDNNNNEAYNNLEFMNNFLQENNFDTNCYELIDYDNLSIIAKNMILHFQKNTQ